jgi:hypothetical protein
MKKIVFGLLMAVCFNSNAQKDTLDFSAALSSGTDIKALKEFSKQFKDKQTFESIKEDKIYKIGDKFKLGIPQKVLGTVENTHFLSLYLGNAISTTLFSPTEIMTMFVPGNNMYNIKEVEYTITKIGIRKDLGIALPFIVLSNLGSEISTISILGSLLTKELIDPNAPMSSEEAISKLKGLKEKLDLELISKQEYDSQKNELSKFIK